MRLRAIVLVLRKNGFFHTGEAEIFRLYDPTFQGFSQAKVKAVRKRNGWGVALILQPSKIDQDFNVPTLFLSEKEFWDIYEAFRESDRLTVKMLGRGFHSIRIPDEIILE